jgi:hypothetical protein
LEDEAESKKAQSEKLKDITKSVLDPASMIAKKRKSLDDAVSPESVPSNITQNSMSSWEKYMFQRLNDAQGENSADKEVRHAFVYRKIMVQIDHLKLRTPRAFILEAYSEDDYEDKENDSPEMKTLQAVGITTIVSIYCDRCHEFGSQFFEERMSRLGFPLLCVLKIYALLEDFRQNKPWDELVDQIGEPAKKMR